MKNIKRTLFFRLLIGLYLFLAFAGSTLAADPIMNTSRIDPATTAYSNQNLTGYCNATDADGDDLYYYYRWYKNGITYVQGVAIANGTVSVGVGHSCGIRADNGRVVCWGQNNQGQLGNGTIGGNVSTPINITDTAAYSDVKVGGSSSTCAIRANDSKILCWGRDSVGQRGNGPYDSTSVSVPTIINDTASYRGLTGGLGHFCAIRQNDSKVVCWGYNQAGQVGNGTVGSQQENPTLISDTSSFLSVASSPGSVHTCAIRANDSRVLCWGRHSEGALGNGSFGEGSDTGIAVLVNDTAAYSSVATGTRHTCAIRANDSTLHCWGNNLFGQLGTQTSEEENPTPVSTNDTSEYISVTAGFRFTCGIRTNDSRAMCWGENDIGQLGNGTIGGNGAYKPSPVNDSNPYVYISAASADDGTKETVCGIRASDGRILCWGSNSNSGLGNGTEGGNSTTPVLANTTDSFASTMPASAELTAPFTIWDSLTSVDESWTLGCIAYDATTFSSEMNSSSTTILSTPPEMAQARIDPAATAYTSSNLTGYCNATDAESDNLYYYYRWYKEGLTYFQGIAFVNGSISTGEFHSCAIRANDSKAMCWGPNSAGQLGIGNTSDYNFPQTVLSSPAFTKVTAGGSHSCAIRANDSAVMCWGSNIHGQLGIGNTTGSYLFPIEINDSAPYVSVSAGRHYACGLRQNDSKVMCWGRNHLAQLGIGNDTNYNYPVPVNSSETFKYLAELEHAHTCAIRSSDSRVMCWGDNFGGQLGDGTTLFKGNPTLTTDTSAYTAIATGNQHTCGVRADGTATCWGDNTYGQLGIGNTTQYRSPIEVNDSSPYLSVDVGWDHSCGMRASDLRVLCWGNNTKGTLGTGDQVSHANPALTTDTEGYVDLDAGRHNTCGIRADGMAMCWGNNSDGTLGNGSTGGFSTSPVALSTSSTFGVAYSASSEAAMTGSVWSGMLTIGQNWTLGCKAFDSTSFSGQQNSSATQIVSTPPTMDSSRINPAITGYTNQNLTGYCNASDAEGDDLYYSYTWYKEGAAVYQDTAYINGSITVGDRFACGIRANDSMVVCWGRNIEGQLGRGTVGSTFTSPVAISNTSAYLSVKAGTVHVCALRASDRKAVCWGDNTHGQLGNGSEGGSSGVPIVIANESSFLYLDAQGFTTCGILESNGRAMCWGRNNFGQLGNGSVGGASGIPAMIVNTTQFISLDSGASTVCALRLNDSSAECWGDNQYGQFGLGVAFGSFGYAVNGGGYIKFIQVSTGASHVCGIRQNDSRVSCWGRNNIGQIGIGTTGANVASPASISYNDRFAKIAVGDTHTCGLLSSNGTMVCWGDNTYGQVGNGSVGGEAPTPIGISNSTPFIDLAANYRNTCAVNARGNVMCWGDNSQAALGNSTAISNISTPVGLNDTQSYAGIASESLEVQASFFIGSSMLALGQNWTLGCSAFDATSYSDQMNSSTTNIQQSYALSVSSTSDTTTAYANYSVFYGSLTAGSPVTTASCYIWLNISGQWKGNYSMAYNSTLQQYTAIADGGYAAGRMPGAPIGAKAYNITCTDPTYGSLSSTGTVTISNYSSSLALLNDTGVSTGQRVNFYANYTRNGGFYTPGISNELGRIIWNTSDLDSGNNSQVISFFDYDGDGKRDEVIAAFSAQAQPNDIRAFDSNGTTLWAFDGDGFSASFYNKLFVADVHGNNDDEIFFCRYDNSGSYAIVLNRTGSLLWSDSGGNCADAEAADMDGDGLNELIVASIYEINVYNRTGGLLWMNETSFYGTSNTEIEVGDFDRDGRVDDILALQGTSQRNIAYNETGGYLFNFSFSTSTAESVDSDHDGHRDEIYAGGYNTILLRTFHMNSSQQGEQIGNSNLNFDPTFELAVYDVDNDGFEDDVVAAGFGGIFALDNSSTHIWNFTGYTGEVFSMVASDMDGDGLRDIAFVAVDQTLYVLNSSGQLTWKLNISQGARSEWYSDSPELDASDVNGDGLNDLALITDQGYAYTLNEMPDCSIAFNDSRTYNMTWNATDRRWELNRTFATSGTYSYNVTCSKGGYSSQLVSSALTIGSTCSYSGTGNWTIQGTENCIVTSNVDLGRNNLYVIGPGNLTLIGNVTNWTERRISDSVIVRKGP